MRILQDKKQQAFFKNLYWREGRKVLLKTVSSVIARAEYVTPHELKYMVRGLLHRDEMEEYIETLWLHTGSKFAYNMVKKIKSKKDNEDQLSFWEKLYRKYAAERSAKILGILLDTQAENINMIIDRYITEGESLGLGIQNIANRMRSGLEGDLIDIQNYEAERIARTEVIGASNRGSFEGAQSTGVDVQKFWMHSGILSPGYRQEHVVFESMGSQDMDYEYAPGLQFPGDDNGEPDQTINCRCTIGYDTGNMVDESLWTDNN